MFNQGNGIQHFWKCSHCRAKIATNYEEFEETWWSSPPKFYEIPDSCPKCESEETYVEQAEITLIEIFDICGYRQWSNDGPEGWRIKIEIDK
jgi:hypothetical protein